MRIDSLRGISLARVLIVIVVLGSLAALIPVLFPRPARGMCCQFPDQCLLYRTEPNRFADGMKVQFCKVGNSTCEKMLRLPEEPFGVPKVMPSPRPRKWVGEPQVVEEGRCPDGTTYTLNAYPTLDTAF